MISQTLREARKYEEATEKMISGNDRPEFHLSARVGWMNDPNGFSFYNGQYHMFYQYHPYDNIWGPMHWGHAVSSDLLRWEFLPAALAPDEPYDRDGCFSGSAVTLPDGRQLLMYTGVIKERLKNGGVSEVQTQCLALGDGTDYEKYEKNPVLDEKDLPEGASRYDFRDPKMWRREDGTYYCIAGNRAADGSGQVLLFTSPDGFKWQYRKVLAANNNRPMDMLPSGFEYHNGNGTLCLIGDFDEKTENFSEEHNQAVDYGIDFYAPQTILAPDGRRIMIGWMQNWDTCNFRTQNISWFGQMSLPRELSIQNGRLYQNPVRELEKLRQNKVSCQDVLVSDTVRLEGIKGRKVDMELTIRPCDGEAMYQKFAVRFAQNEKYQTSLSFRPRESILKIDRKFSGSRRAIIHQRRSRVNSKNGELKLRIILDRFSVEAFVNDGEQVMTAIIYTEQQADGISFFADGAALMDVVKYDLV